MAVRPIEDYFTVPILVDEQPTERHERYDTGSDPDTRQRAAHFRCRRWLERETGQDG